MNSVERVIQVLIAVGAVFGAIPRAWGAPDAELSDNPPPLVCPTGSTVSVNLNLRTNIMATPPENVHTDNVEGVGQRFYRVRVE